MCFICEVNKAFSYLQGERAAEREEEEETGALPGTEGLCVL